MVGETLYTCSSTAPDTACDTTDTPRSDSDTYAPESAITSLCTCLCRRTPPPKPTEIPFPATENNRMKLQQLLLDYYRTSTFTTCEHQPLPLTESVPVRLMVDPSADLVAHHTPIPVPLHWQEYVKAGIDQDASLGVLEPVPVGEPVTWCHCMVVCAKKNGKPQCTVDLNLQALKTSRHTCNPSHTEPIPSSMLYTQ